LALVVGYGITEDRFQQPRLADPHGLSLAWLRAAPGAGMRTHRIAQSQVLLVKSGRLRVTLNRDHPVTTEIGAYDVLSVPPGAWRRFEAVGDEPVQFVVLTEGDGRVQLEWSPDVVTEARADGVAIDPNGYVAPAALLNR
jgi:mannose-6-phosphate isomerase-like protein (cupin superfamily)